MAGYFLKSKSNNAIEAESEDRYPLSVAKKILAEKLGWSQIKSKAFLLDFGTSEWHHSSRYYNEIDYYNVSDEFISDNKKEIESFVYVPQKKKETILYFKCWNIEKDVRKWSWKITNREGNNCHSLNVVLRDVQAQARRLDPEQIKHKTQKRIAQEKLDVLKAIEKEILNALP